MRLDGESGQTLVEYALIIALVALAAIVALGFLSGKINSLFSKSGNSLNAVQVAAGAGAPPPPAAPSNGTTLSLSNTTAFNNASGLWQAAGLVQECSPQTLVNLALCVGGNGTWVTVGVAGVYAQLPFTRSGSCSFTYNTGFAFAGTWSGNTGLYRLGTSGNPDYGEACL